ncbi:hypothetical protein ACWJJH_18825 [Endozoicomonadaceae bacterium StTr2]
MAKQHKPFVLVVIGVILYLSWSISWAHWSCSCKHQNPDSAQNCEKCSKPKPSQTPGMAGTTASDQTISSDEATRKLAEVVSFLSSKLETMPEDKKSDLPPELLTQLGSSTDTPHALLTYVFQQGLTLAAKDAEITGDEATELNAAANRIAATGRPTAWLSCETLPMEAVTGKLWKLHKKLTDTKNYSETLEEGYASFTELLTQNSISVCNPNFAGVRDHRCPPEHFKVSAGEAALAMSQALIYWHANGAREGALQNLVTQTLQLLTSRTYGEINPNLQTFLSQIHSADMSATNDVDVLIPFITDQCTSHAAIQIKLPAGSQLLVSLHTAEASAPMYNWAVGPFFCKLSTIENLKQALTHMLLREQ